jgi:hypothetical protein
MFSLGLLLALCSSTRLQPVAGIPLSDFYPFGSAAGDFKLPRSLDGNSPGLPLNFTFSYLGELVPKKIYVSGGLGDMILRKINY